MGSQAMIFQFCVILLVQGALGEVWEFGVDAPGSIIVDHKEGDFSLFERNKEIQLKPPQCYVIEYVRVQVDNKISTPKVNFNNLSNSVTISYTTFQISLSKYHIIAKAERKPGCFNEVVEVQKRNKFRKFSHN